MCWLIAGGFLGDGICVVKEGWRHLGLGEEGNSPRWGRKRGRKTGRVWCLVGIDWMWVILGTQFGLGADGRKWL